MLSSSTEEGPSAMMEKQSPTNTSRHIPGLDSSIGGPVRPSSSCDDIGVEQFPCMPGSGAVFSLVCQRHKREVEQQPLKTKQA